MSPTAPRTPWRSSASIPRRKKSRFLGLIPTGWWPGSDPSTTRGAASFAWPTSGPGREKRLDKRTGAIGFNPTSYLGSLSLIPVPSEADLPAMTRKVWEKFLPGSGSPSLCSRPGPDNPPGSFRKDRRTSLIKHVVYIIKENRAYDQVLGDVRKATANPP